MTESYSYDDAPRNSLLDVVMTEYDKLQDPKIYSRVLYVAEKIIGEKTSDDTTTSVRQYHLNLFEKSGHREDEFCGLMYESDAYCIHILEATTSTVMDFLRTLHEDIAEMSKAADATKGRPDEQDKGHVPQIQLPRVTNVKILLYTDDFGKGVSFPLWSCKEIPNAKLLNDSDDEEEMTKSPSDSDKRNAEQIMGVPWIVKIHRLLHQMLFVAGEIFNLGTMQISIFFETLATKHAVMIPRESLIESMVKHCDECFTLQEFVEVFASTVDVTLESELVWPTQGPLYLT